MSDISSFERGEEAQRDHLRQLSARHARLPEGATLADVRRLGGWSTDLVPLPAAALMARRPELFVLRDRILCLRVKCRSCRVEQLMPLVSSPEEGEEVVVNRLPRFAVWIAQRWCCEPCGEREMAAQSRKDVTKALDGRVRGSGIPRALAEAVSWETMLAKGLDGEQTKKRTRALEVARAWAAEEKPKHALLIWGAPGTGKTRLAATAAVARLQHSPITWVSVTVLMARLQAAWNDDDRRHALKVLTGRGPVVLDDLDKITLTPAVLTQLFTAIDSREQAGERAVIFTANSDPSEMGGKLGDVLMSRITGMCHSNAGVLPFPGPDRRLELGEAQSEQAAEAAAGWGL